MENFVKRVEEMTDGEKKGLLDGAGALTTGGTTLAVLGFIIPIGAVAIPVAGVAAAAGMTVAHVIGKKVFND